MNLVRPPTILRMGGGDAGLLVTLGAGAFFRGGKDGLP